MMNNGIEKRPSLGIEKRPSLGMDGYPAQEYWKNNILLGKITQTGIFSFWWEVNKSDEKKSGRYIHHTHTGHELDATYAEKALLSAAGINHEITNECPKD